MVGGTIKEREQTMTQVISLLLASLAGKIYFFEPQNIYLPDLIFAIDR